ncbi:MAG: NAD(P)H-dependent oxidoreductase, partial [Bacteroidota bacterium]|nr:NAD(P)H-dependent oxidoreductase [Bacteroidota bacterium]
HPNLASFNGHLRTKAIEFFNENEIQYTVSDLYQTKFKASADENDFISLVNPTYFDLQLEQAQAILNGSFVDDIKNEQQLLYEADLIIFQFPLWWYSMPGLLKGYIDRIFSMGWAYGGAQALKGKRILVSTTTGAPEMAWTENNRGTIKDIFKHLFIGTFGLTGLDPVEPFIVYGAKRLNDDQKKSTTNNYRNYLKSLTI